MTEAQHYTVFSTQLGFVALAWTTSGVTSLRLPARSEAAAEAAVLRRMPQARRAAPPQPIARVIADIVRYFDGAKKVDFADVPVDLGPQEPFFSAVYAEVRKLGWGETTTYGAIARSLGAEPQAARDVGQAMASNPVPLIVPCHRVLAAGGKVGGFSAPGGSRAKARMLEIEGVGIAATDTPPRPKQTSSQIGFGF